MPGCRDRLAARDRGLAGLNGTDHPKVCLTSNSKFESNAWTIVFFLGCNHLTPFDPPDLRLKHFPTN